MTGLKGLVKESMNPKLMLFTLLSSTIQGQELELLFCKKALQYPINMYSE